MEKKEFAARLSDLRISKNISAREMSLAIGQSPNYINNIENQVNYPSMSAFFYICEYLGITAIDFFDTNVKEPCLINDLIKSAKCLNAEQLKSIILIVTGLNGQSSR